MEFWMGIAIGSGFSMVVVTIFFMWLLRMVVRKSREEKIREESYRSSQDDYLKDIIETRKETNVMLEQLVFKIGNLK